MQIDINDFLFNEESFVKNEGEYFETTFALQKSTGLNCVIYKINKHGAEISLIKELQILSVKHPAIVPFIGIADTNTGVYLIFERMEKGSLNNAILKSIQKEPYPLWDEKHKIMIAYGIACAMEYLHSQNIFNRHLNSNKIFLDKDLHPYISILKTNNSSFNDCKMNENVYEYGNLLYYLLTDKDSDQISFESPDNLDLKWRELIGQCWMRDLDRPSFEQIRQTLESEEFHVPKNYSEKFNVPRKSFIYLMEPKQIISAEKKIKKEEDIKKDDDIKMEIKLLENSFLDELKNDADAGDPSAQNSFALRLYNGLAVEKDIDEAIRYFRLAADNGNYEAMLWLSIILTREGGHEEEAAKYYERSVSSGQVPETFSIYAQQRVNEGDIEGALEYLPFAVQHGSISGMLLYGNVSEEGSELQSCFYEMAANCCHCLDTVGFYFPIDYKVYYCKDCGSTICEGCAKHCHKSHSVEEIGVDHCFVCDCGKNHFVENGKKNRFGCSIQFVGEMIVDKKPCCNQHLFKCMDCAPNKFICFGCASECHANHRVVDCGIQKGFCCCGGRQMKDKCCKNVYYAENPIGRCVNLPKMQRYFQCMSCGIYGSDDVGICSNCAHKCHEGHILLDRGVKKRACQCNNFGQCIIKK